MAKRQQEDDQEAFIGPQEKKTTKQWDESRRRHQPKAPFWKQNEEEPPQEKQISEAELQLKNMVEKQLSTTISLESELAKKKQFHKASVFKDDQEKRSGAQTLESFKKHSALEQEFEEMRNCGLTDQEIAIKTSQDLRGFGPSELAASRKEDEIHKKIDLHRDYLQSNACFSSAKEMTRLEIEIEQSLYRGTKKADELKHLFKAKKEDYPENDPVMKTLQEYEEKEKRKQRNSKLAKKSQPPRNVDPCENTDEDSDNDKEFVGPVLAPLHIRVKPIQEREVQLHKLTVQEIKSINKFSNYDPGTPSKKLYLKNLPRNVTKEDLASIFNRFESISKPCMEYKVLEGRMKGQAFISFPDEATASRALQFANGYILNDKPMIISFGRDGKSS